MMQRKLRYNFQAGLSMIEVLIVIAIIALLVILAITTLPEQIEKGRDGRRKSDLQKIKIAFENYYSDNDCYPPDDILDNCEGTELSPYLARIPCDPRTKEKYLYAPVGGACPTAYRVYADLEVDEDPIIEELGCHTDAGCGAYQYFQLELGLAALDYDYGVSEGVPVFDAGGGIPAGTFGWCCQTYGDPCNVWEYGSGICNVFFFEETECQTACGN